MAINGYRTIPTDGSGELYSWPGCVVLVSAGWTDGPAFAERVAHTDHEDAAQAFRDLAGWLLARSGDTVADFAAVLQTGSSLLCMAAGDSEVLLGDGRRVAADVSGMWAQLVLAERPGRLELGVSVGLEPERVDLEHGVVPADGVLLIPGGGDSPESRTGIGATATGASTVPPTSPGTTSAPEAAGPAGSTTSGSDTDGHPSARLAQPATTPPGAGASSPAQPFDANVGEQPASKSVDAAGAGSISPAPSGSQRVAEATESGATPAALVEAAPDEINAPEGDLGADPRGSPGAASAGPDQARHQLPFDAEFEGQPTDADGLVGLVSEEPEPSGTSGSATPATARSADFADDEAAETPEPTGEHLSASTFTEDGEPEGDQARPTAEDEAPGGEATGLVPIVTTPAVPSGSVSGPVGDGQNTRSTTEAPGRSHRGSIPPPPEEAWPPPPAWAPGSGAAFDDEADGGQPSDRTGGARADDRRSGDPRLDDPGFGSSGPDADGIDDRTSATPSFESADFDDAGFDGPDDDGDPLGGEEWAGDWAVTGDVGSADADLLTGEATDDEAEADHGAASSEAGPEDDTNERAWDSDGLDDDHSIPLLLFDDGVAVELPGDVLIGRRPDPGVRDDPSRLHTLTMTDDSQAVSRNHVELRRRNDEVSIVDCGSANGTFVEATPGELTRLEAEAPHTLRDGERVVFGKRWFEYRAPHQPDSDE